MVPIVKFLEFLTKQPVSNLIMVAESPSLFSLANLNKLRKLA
jgi:hypothetical protein